MPNYAIKRLIFLIACCSCALFSGCLGLFSSSEPPTSLEQDRLDTLAAQQRAYELEREVRMLSARLAEAEKELARRDSQEHEITVNADSQPSNQSAALQSPHMRSDSLQPEADPDQHAPQQLKWSRRELSVQPLAAFTSRHSGLIYQQDKNIAKVDANVLFLVGQARLNAEARERIAQLTPVFRSAAESGFQIVVAGHADDSDLAPLASSVSQQTAPPQAAPPQTALQPSASRQPPDPNDRLLWKISAARADEVARFLQQHGAPSKRMVTLALSAAKPITIARTPQDQRRNRRVEIYIMDRDATLIDF